jgi:DNA polymerase-3 subunit gamma/tau
MSYLVLARKYRPTTFSEVTGQEVVTQTLQGAIQEERIGHAYLLCGPRGTGKTTTARLFAKALNCEKGPTLNPCGACNRCMAAESGTETDVIEIDAATHTGVDNVRELRNQAAYAPLKARYKIYIIDEVHMLSKGAFNALLKTLEEPPPHVKFLFATTEPHKLPDTILSRCQVLKLSALSEADIEKRLDEVFALENVQAEAGVSAAIARRSRGGMRDALSLADQLLALVGDQPTVADTQRLAGGADRDGIERLVGAMVGSNRGLLLSELVSARGGERELVDSLMEYLRGCLLCAHCGADNPLVDAPQESRAGMVELAKRLGGDRIELMLEDLLHARDQMRVLPGQAPLILELALLQLARPEATLPMADLVERLLNLEQRIGQAPALAPGAATQAAPASQSQSQSQAPGRSGVVQPMASASQSPAPAPQRAPAPAPRPAAAPAPAPAASRRQQPQFAGAVRSSKGEAWKRFIQDLTDRAPALGGILGANGKLLELSDGRAIVRFEKLRQADQPLVQDARNQKLCSRVFSDLMGEPVEVRLEDGSAISPGDKDPFTRRVREGRIED